MRKHRACAFTSHCRRHMRRVASMMRVIRCARYACAWRSVMRSAARRVPATLTRASSRYWFCQRGRALMPMFSRRVICSRVARRVGMRARTACHARSLHAAQFATYACRVCVKIWRRKCADADIARRVAAFRRRRRRCACGVCVCARCLLRVQRCAVAAKILRRCVKTLFDVISSMRARR